MNHVCLHRRYSRVLEDRIDQRDEFAPTAIVLNHVYQLLRYSQDVSWRTIRTVIITIGVAVQDTHCHPEI